MANTLRAALLISAIAAMMTASIAAMSTSWAAFSQAGSDKITTSTMSAASMPTYNLSLSTDPAITIADGTISSGNNMYSSYTNLQTPTDTSGTHVEYNPYIDQESVTLPKKGHQPVPEVPTSLTVGLGGVLLGIGSLIKKRLSRKGIGS